ncbi:uncharacterized protein LOC111714049 isoform X2 [Eurytemora carolleeae]|uniref:uncharacterized protein LOC111714049 isoform X2 n=1 Tax=Eurytemora carolleeae TaxID=1294199 RepID=UPI000C77EEA6|nr:uncharacterized protein LOC111714049 isoform X2 [Eurytemora carolleeae]|eukprot:XP_023344831.1 uncharacterized protein LOC111714049 isoform X2 [Eurytemora affinis]
MLRPMKLEGALKLYIALYSLALSLTFLTSIPMLKHVGPEGDCLLFTTPPPIAYGSTGGCYISGIIPIFVAVCALGLIFIHWLQLRNLRKHIKLPEMSSDEFRMKFKKKFWKMIILHSIVVGLVAMDACILTAGYATSCRNIYTEVESKLRNRLSHTPISNRGADAIVRQAHEIFADDHTINRYSNDNQDILGRNKFEQRITCRAMFTDEKNHYDLKKNSANNQYLASIYGFWNQGQKNVADIGNFRNKAYTDNLILELSMAGAWIGFFVWILMLLLMLKERHHLKAFITDESMWGGSDYGAGSVRSGRSRKSSHSHRPLSPMDFENDDRMSKISFDRSSRVSRGSRGTSYKDMGRKPSTNNGSTGYKNMGHIQRGSGAPSQLTVSRLEKVPEVAEGYTVNRLLNPSLDLDARSVADMSVLTVTGAIIGPGTQHNNRGPRNAGGLMDFFNTPQKPDNQGDLQQTHGRHERGSMITEETDII